VTLRRRLSAVLPFVSIPIIAQVSSRSNELHHMLETSFTATENFVNTARCKATSACPRAARAELM
jgi:hypothetical protein